MTTQELEERERARNRQEIEDVKLGMDLILGAILDREVLSQVYRTPEYREYQKLAIAVGYYLVDSRPCPSGVAARFRARAQDLVHRLVAENIIPNPERL